MRGGVESPHEDMSEIRESDPDVAAREAKELRERMYQDALHAVCERYPDLREKIMSSLQTPQMGDYHCEGPTMESHLKLIVAHIRDIAEGTYHDVLANDEEVREAFQRVIRAGVADHAEEGAVNPELLEYVFFHDIDKQTSLLFKFEGEKDGAEVTLEDWQKISQDGPPFLWEGKVIKSISYFHPSKGKDGAHGIRGTQTLADLGLSRVMLTGIAKHEVAYSFNVISAATYEKHFVDSALNDEEQDFVAVASYVDTMSSLRPNGEPDMRNYGNFLQSRKNYLLIKQALDLGTGLHKNDAQRLKHVNRPISMDDIDAMIARRKEQEALRQERIRGQHTDHNP